MSKTTAKVVVAIYSILIMTWIVLSFNVGGWFDWGSHNAPYWAGLGKSAAITIPVVISVCILAYAIDTLTSGDNSQHENETQSENCESIEENDL